MTANDDLDRQLTDLLRDGPTELPHESFNAVRSRTEESRQRVVFGPWRTTLMSKTVTIGLAAAAVVVAAFVGAQLFGSPSDGTGGPGDEPTSMAAPTATIGQVPSQAPSPSAAESAVADFPGFPGPPRPIDAGMYAVGPDFPRSARPEFPVNISFVVPAGWLSCTNNAEFLCLADGGGVVNIDIVTNVFADPCDETTVRDPGPTVDDLVTAISSLPWSAVTPPTDVTVDGVRGQDFEVTAPSTTACAGTDDFSVWETTIGRRATVSPGEQWRLRILDVQGTRVVIAGSYLPGTTSSEGVDEINAIIDSVRIETDPPG